MPGFTDELITAGAGIGDELAEGRWLFSGHRLARAATGRMSLFASRPLVEGHLRARVRAISTVNVLDECDALGLTTTADQRGVTGVHLLDRALGSMARTLGADLVLDATGRGSSVPTWLQKIATRTPEREKVEIGSVTPVAPSACGPGHSPGTTSSCAVERPSIRTAALSQRRRTDVTSCRSPECSVNARPPN